MQLFFISTLLFTSGQTYHQTFSSPIWTKKLPTTYRLAASCRSGSALRDIMHLISVFSSTTHRASIPPYVGILAWRPPHYLYTVAYGMCSVPPHIPYPFRFAPGALLRKRCFATLARYLYISLLFPFTFSQNFLFHAVAYVLSNRLLL